MIIVINGDVLNDGFQMGIGVLHRKGNTSSREHLNIVLRIAKSDRMSSIDMIMLLQ